MTIFEVYNLVQDLLSRQAGKRRRKRMFTDDSRKRRPEKTTFLK
jgi:hypothetical protein